MTTQQTTIAEAFVAALPDDLRHVLVTTSPHRKLNAGLTSSVAYNIGRAVNEQGWSIEQLVAECARNPDGQDNPGGVITERIRVAATVPPRKTKTAAIPKGVPFCSPECKDNAGWILDGDGRPVDRCQCRSTT